MNAHAACKDVNVCMLGVVVADYNEGALRKPEFIHETLCEA